jgi:UDP-N-acetylmuramate dehydrogenase
MSAADYAPLKEALGDALRLDEPLALHTSFRIGGPADAFAEVRNRAQLDACLVFAAERGLPWRIVGAGTNLLVRDAGVRGLVLKLGGDFSAWTLDGGILEAGAAAPLALLARRSAEAGWAGLEWAAGIPGTLAGGLVMNAGAHGGELAGVVRRVELLERGRRVEWSAAECGFGYRNSRLKNAEPGTLVALGAILALTPGDAGALKAKIAGDLARRKAGQPLEFPNAGCAFRNPPADAAGRLIEACGLKGLRKGGAEISARHANFVVNTGGAKASDVTELMETARTAVRERFSVELKDEILVWGERT